MLATVFRVAQTKEADKRRVILESWTRTDLGGRSKIDPVELAKQSNDVVSMVIVQDTEVRLRSASGTSNYDEVNCEYVADNFAARMGAGRYVVTGLDKIYKKYTSIKELKGTGSFIFSEIMKIFQFICGFFIGFLSFAALFTMQIPLFVYMMITSLSWIIGVPLMSSNAGDGVYDNIIRRYQRIRLDLVSMLKNKKLSRDLAQQLNNDIDVIDNVLKSYTEHKSWMGAVVDILIPSKRRLKEETQVMAELENLANNEMFRFASNLRNL